MEHNSAKHWRYENDEANMRRLLVTLSLLVIFIVLVYLIQGNKPVQSTQSTKTASGAIDACEGIPCIEKLGGLFEWLAGDIPKNETILTPYEFGAVIQNSRNLKSLVSAPSKSFADEFLPNYQGKFEEEEKFRDSLTALFGTDINVTKSIMHKYNTSYLLLPIGDIVKNTTTCSYLTYVHGRSLGTQYCETYTDPDITNRIVGFHLITRQINYKWRQSDGFKLVSSYSCPDPEIRCIVLLYKLFPAQTSAIDTNNNDAQSISTTDQKNLLFFNYITVRQAIGSRDVFPEICRSLLQDVDPYPDAESLVDLVNSTPRDTRTKIMEFCGTARLEYMNKSLEEQRAYWAKKYDVGPMDGQRNEQETIAEMARTQKDAETQLGLKEYPIEKSNQIGGTSLWGFAVIGLLIIIVVSYIWENKRKDQ